MGHANGHAPKKMGGHMGWIELKCKNCGADLEVNEEERSIICKYCGAKMISDTLEQKWAGYEFEKGVLRAEEEYRKSSQKVHEYELRRDKEILEERLKIRKQELELEETYRKKALRRELLIRYLNWVRKYWIILVIGLYILYLYFR